jgi:DNA transformation protein and related proteins
MNEFTQHVADVLRAFGAFEVRRMFAGYGLFRDGLMFGLVYDETLYLKVDEQNVTDFVRLDLAQFQYPRQGKLVGLSFYRAPDSVMDDAGEAAMWARSSWEAALRANVKKLSKRRMPRCPR